jgi:hypothetical protein
MCREELKEFIRTKLLENGSFNGHSNKGRIDLYKKIRVYRTI